MTAALTENCGDIERPGRSRTKKSRAYALSTYYICLLPTSPASTGMRSRYALVGKVHMCSEWRCQPNSWPLKMKSLAPAQVIAPLHTCDQAGNLLRWGQSQFITSSAAARAQIALPHHFNIMASQCRRHRSSRS